MLSFHGKQEVKDFYLDRIIKHRELDNIIQGTGWENGKGCAVGCTLENYDHSRYPIELGLPEWLARLEDRIFEGLTKKEAILWPEKFLSTIPVGVDVENIRHKLAIKRLDKLILIQQDLLNRNKEIDEKIFLDVIASINIIRNCHESQLNKNYCDWSAAESAWSAADSAWSAAESAWSAAESAWSAAESAWSAADSAWSAARSARSAAWSAESAAWSAESAADSAARSARSAAWSAESAAESAADSAAESAWSAADSAWSAAWKQEADNLLELLSELKE